MPNLHVTDRQVMLYMTSRSRHRNQEAAAASAGFSARTGRRIDNDARLPSQKKQPRTWRTRADPLTEVWPRVREMLGIPGVMAVTIFEDLQDELGPDALPDSVRRTLERRIARWRALHGGDKEVFFPQRHDPGRMQFQCRAIGADNRARRVHLNVRQRKTIERIGGFVAGSGNRFGRSVVHGAHHFPAPLAESR